MASKSIPRKTLWNDIDAKSIAQFGADIADLGKRALWCQAYLFGGNNLRLWNQAAEIKMALLTAASLEKGQNVTLVAKYGCESGIDQALRSLIGAEGSLSSEEIGPRALACLGSVRDSSGAPLQWDYSSFDLLPARSMDRIILFDAASHVGNC